MIKLNPKPLIRNLPTIIGALILMYFTAYFHGEHIESKNKRLCMQSTLYSCNQ